jgi:serine/threonine protein phosphatase PrpC
MAFQTRCFGMTDVGRAREKNEDNFIFVPDMGLYLVADGMGGHASGSLASTLAVKYIAEFVCLLYGQPDFSWPYPKDPDTPDEHHLLNCAIRHANERIYIEALKNPAHEGMGTTIVTVHDPGGDDLILAHVGDSRIYRFRDSSLSQITMDHSLLNHMLSIGKLKPEDAESFPNKNVIFRALGLKDDVQVDVQQVPKRKGDLFLLCSDGLSDLVEDWVIAEIMEDSHNNLKGTASALIKMANHNGGTDNITVELLAID